MESYRRKPVSTRSKTACVGMKTETEIRSAGMNALIDALGTVEAERFRFIASVSSAERVGNAVAVGQRPIKIQLALRSGHASTD